MDYNRICEAIEATGETVPGINAYSYVPDSMANIGLYVGEIDIDLNKTMRGARVNGHRTGTDEANITVRILVARSDDKYSVKKLREFMGGSGMMSIVDAFELNPQLRHPDGLDTVDDSRVTRLSGNRMFQIGPAEARYYGVELDLYVIGDA